MEMKCFYKVTRPGVDKVKPKGWFKYSLQIEVNFCKLGTP